MSNSDPYCFSTNNYLKLANKGNIKAQYMLGMCYLNGDGIKQNKDLAIKWITKAAVKNHIEAQYNLGVIYYYRDSKKDLKLAVKWLTKGAEQEDNNSIAFLGHCYLNGKGVRKSAKHAVELFKAKKIRYDQISKIINKCLLIDIDYPVNNIKNIIEFNKLYMEKINATYKKN